MTTNHDIFCEALTRSGFAPYGDIIELKNVPDKLINSGKCGRHHDLATLDFGIDGRAGISIFKSELCRFPYQLTLLERHPEGTQAFVPMAWSQFLVIVAPEKDSRPRAFLTKPGQGVNFHRGVWHGVLTPLTEPGLFLVVDRIGDTPNLEEFHLSTPWRVLAG
ncbi:MAG: ureidoglycolate lyase [Aestuariivita sp.]|nr:ureidoglycolate lyase [Aestuariivita sp.]